MSWVYVPPDGELVSGWLNTISALDLLNGSQNGFDPASRALRVQSAWGTSLRRVYGEQRVPGDLSWFDLTGTTFRAIYIFSDGPNEDITKLFINGEEIDTSASSPGTTYGGTTAISNAMGPGGRYDFYLGTAAQDITNSTIFSSGAATTDTYANICCVVLELKLQWGENGYRFDGFPRVEALIKGRSDVSGGYTVTPVKCLGHWLTDVFSGTSLDSTSLSDAASRQESLVGGEQRHTWGMVLGDRPRKRTELLRGATAGSTVLCLPGGRHVALRPGRA